GENDIYVISHDDERTKRIAKNVEINTIGANEMGIGDAVKGAFDKKGDQLRKQLENIGFSEPEAEKYEAEIDKGTVYLIVTRTDNVATILSQHSIMSMHKVYALLSLSLFRYRLRPCTLSIIRFKFQILLSHLILVEYNFFSIISDVLGFVHC